MGVYIKGMEMPTSCSECFVKSCRGRANNKRLMVQRGANCPLVPVPPHGDLIDRKALVNNKYAAFLQQRQQSRWKSMDKRRTKSLDGKCGSCRFFTVEQGRECTGFCSGRMKRKGRIERTYKCIGYDAAPTIIEA